jgi:CAAX prenyl protease-like protein
MLLTLGGQQLPGMAHLWYILKTLIVGTMLVAFRRHYPELAWGRSIGNWAIGVVAGILVLVVWVAPEKLFAPFMITQPTGFDPNAFGLTDELRWGVVAMRLLGASIVVPVMEELFWRSFLMRLLVSSDFRRVGVGTFRILSFAVVACLFGLEHHRWIVGIAAGLIYGGLLVWRRDLFTCVLAHGVTNLGLGIYVLQTRQWTFW